MAAEDRDASSSRKRVFLTQPKKSFFDTEIEEKEEKRKKKYRLGNTAVKNSGQKNQRAATNNMVTTEGNTSLTSTPLPYKRPPENILQLPAAQRAKLAEQARRPGFLISGR